MSGKITGKNLHYDQTLPPFLARLHGQNVVDSDSPDPVLAARRRAAKPRSASEEAEDAPLVVDDDGNVVKGLEFGKDGTVKESEASKGEEEEGETGELKDTVKEPEAEKVAAIGASKKRKVGKVIGGEDDEDYRDAPPKDKKGAPTSKTDSTSASKKDSGDKGPAKGKKKAKKIKLSFGDDDGD